MEIQEKVSLAPLTTFGIGGPARFFVEARTESDVVEAVARASERGLPVFVLGGGSNLLVRDAGFAGLVLRVGLRGVKECSAGVYEVAAGEVWDEFVSRVVGEGAAGVECLAGIPGSVGGTPVQNVGAYGQEVAETIVQVRAYDREARAFVELTNAECRFRYRESRFNKDEPGRFIVTRVTFQLRPGGAPTLKYADLQKRFGVEGKPSLAEVAAAVREIRHGKGMLIVAGEADCRSAGSFFKNPVVEAARAEKVAAVAGVALDAMPKWAAGEGRVKLSAAWLLERAGFVKGFADGAAGVSSRHTLALINRGGACCADVERLQERIVGVVAEKFGVVLEREPVLVG